MNLFDYDFTQQQDSSKKLIFFDTETTGSSQDDQIIEIGAIVEDLNGNLIEYYDELCSTENGKLIAPDAMATHGIRNEDLEDKRPFVKSKFWQNIDNLNAESNYFIAHNLPFDLERLKYYGFTPKAKLIDTLQCAKHLYEIDEILGKYSYALPNYKLQTFRYILFNKKQEELEASRFNINIQAHSALSDVIILQMFFKTLVDRVIKNSNCTKEEAIEKLVELSAKPIEVKRFNFGKYKGKLLKEVLEIDRGYLEWLYNDMNKKLNSGESVDENIYITLKNLLEQ